MNAKQWQRVVAHTGFNFSCITCAAVALLDTTNFGEAQLFQIEHKRETSHGVGQTALRPANIMSRIETIAPEITVVLKGFSLFSPREMNSINERR